MRKIWAVMLGILLSFSCVMVSMGDETLPTETWQWQGDYSPGWRYVNQDGAYKKNCWQQIGGYWYHFGREGYAATDWTTIDGYNYCFRNTGDLAIGWCYRSEDEKWYYFNPDGTFQKGWYHAEDGSWYWFSVRGGMAASEMRTIDGQRYYFSDNGQLVANQYMGLYYMDENGHRDKTYDIVLNRKNKDDVVPSDVKDEITAALEHIPRSWIKYFVEHGWQIMYYPDKEYFSAPESDSSPYYVYHSLDTGYRKLKFCEPQALTQAFGEYIGYAADCYGSDSEFKVKLAENKGNVDAFIDVPEYYSQNMQFYFGKLVEAYLMDDDLRMSLEGDSPVVCETLRKVLYGEKLKKS